jgi:hypothetical protein
VPIFDDRQPWPPIYDWDFALVPIAWHAHRPNRTEKLRVLRVFGLRVAFWVLP